jgi:hypothetical protein
MSDVAPQTPPERGGGSSRGPVGETRKLWLVIVLWFVTIGMYGWYWFYKQHKEVHDYSGIGVGGPIGLILAFFVSIVNFFLLPSEVGKMQQQDNVDPDVSGWTGLWVLIPLLGFLIWVVKLQETLNRFWESKGATPA